MIDQYPNIKEVALEIAYCNSMINRFESQEEFLRKASEVLDQDGVTEQELKALEKWLSELSHEEKLTLADGEHDEMVKIEETCPMGGPDNVSLCFLFNDMIEV
jgi:hypothetical protein